MIILISIIVFIIFACIVSGGSKRSIEEEKQDRNTEMEAIKDESNFIGI